MLTKTEIFGFPVKKINYSFKVEQGIQIKRYKKIIIHNTGNVRTIQKIISQHVEKQRYSSIGYHFLIGKNGQVYYARDLSQIGAHTFGNNKDSIGIALFGNLTLNEPTRKQLETLTKLVDTLKKELNISEILGHNQAIYNLIKEKFSKAKLPDVDPLDIHSDIKYYEFIKDVLEKVKQNYSEEEYHTLLNRLKACPGFHLYGHLKELQQLN